MARRRDPLDGYDPGDDLDFLAAGPADAPTTVHVVSRSAALRLPRALRGVVDTDPRSESMWHLMHGTVITICGKAIYRNHGRAADVHGRFTDCFPDDQLCRGCYRVLATAGQTDRAFAHAYPLTLAQARGRLVGRPTTDDPGNADTATWPGYPDADVDHVLTGHPTGQPVEPHQLDAYLRELDRLGDLRAAAETSGP